MPERPKDQPLSNEELLASAEQFLNWARNNYRNQYATPDQVSNMAILSLAASGIVIARSLTEQVALMQEVSLPDTSVVTEGTEQ